MDNVINVKSLTVQLFLFFAVGSPLSLSVSLQMSRVEVLAIVSLLFMASALCAKLPAKLKPGDTVGFISPAYSVLGDDEKWTIETFKKHVETGLAGIGLKVVFLHLISDLSHFFQGQIWRSRF